MRFALFLLASLAGNAAAAPPVILISVDTLRADRLGCYGSRGPGTPHIDAMTNGGTLFSQAAAQVPLTLPSHVSLLTSTYPFSNGVEDNGQAVPLNAVTLATILKARGYRTAGFVGGFVLDRRFGLDRGFDVYDSPFTLPRDRETDAADLKRLGEDVMRSARGWIEKNSGGPFFVFLHLFDLHTPENLPPAVRARFPGPRYEAELAYVDELLGQFWDFLAKRDLVNKALIVFLSDHGEGLGDHGESTHGYFIYQSTLRVPLIIHWPAGSGAAPARIDDPVTLLGVAPTILQFAGVSAPATFQGKSLTGLWKSKAAAGEEVYGESLYAHDHFSTAGLLSLRVGTYKYIQAPKPELYDLAKDPAEEHNLYSTGQTIALTYRRRLNALRARYRPRRKPAAASQPEKVLASLRSLGYLAGSAGPPGSIESGPDPKDRIADYTEYRHAISLSSAGRFEESRAVLESILARQPGQLEVRGLLGLTQQRLEDNESAVKSFRQVLQKNPINAVAHFNLAISYSRLNQLDDAIKELQAAIAIASSQGRTMEQVSIPAGEELGRIWLRKNEYEKAKVQFTDLLKVAPDDYEAHYNLAWLAGRDGRLDEAIANLQAAIKAEPQSAMAHNALGSVYLQQKDWDRAGAEFSEAIRLDAKLAFAHYNLGLVLGRKGDRDGAAKQFREALKADPQLRPARDALNRMGQN